VVGIGVGEKIVDGKATGVYCVKFFVQTKYPEAQIGTKDLLPKHIHGLPTDVEETGLFRRFANGGGAMPDPRAKRRPAQPGCSIGFADPNNQFVMAGTFGALVKDSMVGAFRIVLLVEMHRRVPPGNVRRRGLAIAVAMLVAHDVFQVTGSDGQHLRLRRHVFALRTGHRDMCLTASHHGHENQYAGEFAGFAHVASYRSDDDVTTPCGIGLDKPPACRYTSRSWFSHE
jgi:hypothetical protein